MPPIFRLLYYQGYAPLHHMFMNIEQPATWKDLFELILQQLIHTGSTGDQNCLDIHIVKGIGDTMKQYPVLGCNLASPVVQPGCGLWITATAITGWHDCLRTHPLHEALPVWLCRLH